MLRRKHVTLRQMVHLLEQQANHPNKRIGELAIEAGYVDKATVEALVSDQSASGTQHPIDTLRRQTTLSHDTLFEAMVAYIKLVEEPAAPSTV